MTERGHGPFPHPQFIEGKSREKSTKGENDYGWLVATFARFYFNPNHKTSVASGPCSMPQSLSTENHKNEKDLSRSQLLLDLIIAPTQKCYQLHATMDARASPSTENLFRGMGKNALIVTLGS